MTKYVLNSGGLKNQPELARQFFTEVFKGLGNTPRMLMCFFAYESQNGEQKFKEEQTEGYTFFPEGVKPTVELAQPEVFEAQVKENDIIFLRGGDDERLMMRELRNTNIPKIFEGKIVAASSAGSDVLATSFFDLEWRIATDGLGILPIKFIPHYESEYGADDPRGPINWLAGYEELKTHGDTSLPIHALKEGEYVVIEK